MNKIYYSWKDIREVIESLSLKIKSGEEDILYVTGVPRGGLIPAVMISHNLELKYISYENAINLPEASRSKVLLVDDICDSGETFKGILSYNFITCTLFTRYTSVCTPNYSGKEINTDAWLVFPWEKAGSRTERDGTLS